MPVTDPNMPEELKTALEAMERDVQSFKTDISYQAPEVHNSLWGNVQQQLAETMRELYNSLSPEPYEGPPTNRGGET